MTDDDKTLREKGEKGEIGENASSGHVSSTSSKTPLVEKVAHLTLQGTSSHFEVFEFRAASGNTLKLAMPRSQASRPNCVIGALLDAGVDYVALPVLKEAVVRAIGSRPKESGLLVIVGGWTSGGIGREFVMADHVIGVGSKENSINGPEHDVLYPCIGFNGKLAWNLVGENGVAEGSVLKFSRRGTLKEWKANVAAPASGSSRMMFCISAAFAAPLVRVLPISPFTILISGPSTGGKTSTTLAASSVIGVGQELEFANWDLSEAGLEELARNHSDLLLPIDDLATAGNSPKELHRLITTVPYRITAGSKRGRMQTAMTAVSGRPTATKGIATIVLTSSEKTLAELAADAGGTIPDGIKVRFVEVPQATPEEGGLFDRNSAIKSGRETKRQVEEITTACAKFHGVVLARWLRELVKKPEKAKKFFNKVRKKFLEEARIDSKSSLELRHADRFAFIYAAGEGAIEAGLLPWKKEDLREAVMECCLASRKALNPPDDMLQRGLRRLKKKLSDKSLFVSEGKPLGDRNTCGTILKTGDVIEFVILGDKFRSWFSSNDQQSRVERHLLRRKYISRGSDGKITRQKKLGSEARVRCYVVRLSKGWKEL